MGNNAQRIKLYLLWNCHTGAAAEVNKILSPCSPEHLNRLSSRAMRGADFLHAKPFELGNQALNLPFGIRHQVEAAGGQIHILFPNFFRPFDKICHTGMSAAGDNYETFGRSQNQGLLLH